MNKVDEFTQCMKCQGDLKVSEAHTLPNGDLVHNTQSCRGSVPQTDPKANNTENTGKWIDVYETGYGHGV